MVPVRVMSGSSVATAPDSRQFLLVFIDLFEGGGTRQRAQWHLIPLPTRAGRKWCGSSQSRLCSRDQKICCYEDALSTIFLLACFCALLHVFCISFFFSFVFFYLFFLHQFMFIFFVSLRLCSRHMLLSASTYFIVRVLSACVSFTLPHLGILLFSYSCRIFLVAPFCLVAFLLCSRTRYTSTWFVYVDSLAFGFCPSHCLWPHNLYRSRMKNQEGH